jgi:hypothetical protein
LVAEWTARHLTEADLPHNAALPAIDVDPDTFAIRIDGKPVDRTTSEPTGGTASGRDAKSSRTAANSAGSQASVLIAVIMHDPKETATGYPAP